MSSQAQQIQMGKIFRAFVGAGIVLGPYIYTMARPEKTLKYRFARATDENGQNVRAESSFNRFATEMAIRMKLNEQMRRSAKFDIRLAVHQGLEFDFNGHFTPIFDGIVYVMVPQWANLSSIDDLKKVKISFAGQTLDFSHLDLTKIDTSKLKLHRETVEKTPIVVQNESKSWYSNWFASNSSPPPAPLIEKTISSTPLSRELLLIQKLIETFDLSDAAKKYIIADQLEMATGPWHLVPWMIVAGSFFLPFSLYTRLRARFKTRFQRFLFFHFLLFNGLACFYLSPFAGRLANLQISRIRDSSTIANGLDVLEGGIEYLEKQIERNRILRELLPNGVDLFENDGERRKTRVEIPNSGGIAFYLHHWNPLLNYRLKKLRQKLDGFLEIPENEAKKSLKKQKSRDI